MLQSLGNTIGDLQYDMKNPQKDPDSIILLSVREGQHSLNSLQSNLILLIPLPRLSLC